ANVYVTYTGSNSIIPANFVVTAKFDSSGNLKWKIRYNAPSAVTALTLDKFNNVYIAGEGFVIKYSQLTGTEELQSHKNQLLIYPNPADDYIKVNCPACQKKIKIEIVNPLGQLILSKNNFDNYCTIDISHFSKGIYFLKVYSEQIIYSQKFIRE
ncbi:MAG: T9SS type A sorting domain-containing protein, partial [Bacteroidia bacterium]